MVKLRDRAGKGMLNVAKLLFLKGLKKEYPGFIIKIYISNYSYREKLKTPEIY